MRSGSERFPKHFIREGDIIAESLDDGAIYCGAPRAGRLCGALISAAPAVGWQLDVILAAQEHYANPRRRDTWAARCPKCGRVYIFRDAARN